MKGKLIIMSVVCSCLLLTGCIDENKTMPLGKKSGDAVYSRDGSTVIVFVSSPNSGNTTLIVDMIDNMYDTGYKYICMVPIPDTGYSGSNAFYLVFRKG